MENFYDNVERYLQGELTEDELKAFEIALQRDKALAQSVSRQREMIERLEAARLRNKVKSALSPEFLQPTTAKTGMGYWSWSALVLLFLAILAGVYVYFASNPGLNSPENQPGMQAPTPSEAPAGKSENNAPESIPIAKAPENRPQQLALVREFHVEPSQTFVRDAAPAEDPASPKNPYQQALELYEKKRYSQALEQLGKMKIDGQTEEAQYLRANIRFLVSDFAGAAHDFKGLESSFQFKYEAQWNFMLCQIALDKTAQARVLLTEMAADKDFPYHSKALELKRKTGL